MQFQTDGLLILLPIIVDKRLPHSLFLGNTRLEAMFGKMHKQGLQVVATSPALHLLERTIQSSLKHFLKSP